VVQTTFPGTLCREERGVYTGPGEEFLFTTLPRERPERISEGEGEREEKLARTSSATNRFYREWDKTARGERGGKGGHLAALKTGGAS